MLPGPGASYVICAFFLHVRKDPIQISSLSDSHLHPHFFPLQVSLVSRLEKLFLANFLEISLPLIEEDMPPLKAFLEPCEGSEKEEKESAPVSG